MPKYRVKRHSVTQPSDQSYRLIPLTRNLNAIVDTADFESLSQWNWATITPSKTRVYAKRDEGKKTVYMHQQILTGYPEIDHRNGNGLDNRRENLRPCTSAQNKHNSKIKTTNTSGYKGVDWMKSKKKWRARIKLNYTEVHLGLFESAKEAARVYDAAALKFHGEFAHLNFHRPSFL